MDQFQTLFGMLARHARRSICIRQRGACVLMLVLLTAGAVRAQPDTGYEVHPDYTVRHWTTADGLPVNGGNHLLRTQDSYLWIASRDGLTRFGGGKFTVFNTINTPAFSSNRIHQLHEEPNGALWIRLTPQEIVRFQAGRFDRIDHLASEMAGFKSTGDTLWFPVADGLAMYHNGKQTRYRPDVLTNESEFLVRDRLGQMWVNMPSKGIARFDPEGNVRWFVADSFLQEYASDAWEDWERGVWVINERLAVHIAGTQVSEYSRGAAGIMHYHRIDKDMQIPVDPSDGTGKALWAPDSTIWRYISMTGNPGGQGARSRGSVYRQSERIFQIEGTRVTDIELDSDGSIWVLTQRSGLFRLQQRSITTYGIPEGLPTDNVYPVMQAQDGTMWVGTSGGVATVQEDRVAKVFPSIRFPDSERTASVLSLFEERTGQVWVSTWSGPCHINGDVCESWSLPLDVQSGHIRAMLEDDQNRLWLGAGRGIALRTGSPEDPDWQWLSFEESQNRQARVIRQIRNGPILVGTNGGGYIAT